ncbi:BZ3500_MvSof-1268-A1-R1_Chr3-2g06325 [Microbotryum saponariae]|uniref:BZ3500_MvSof-1268-A1-R1_Chr3-2g06325 protein n=1 Tax=Microbotryum saponariae TaxID=289078 RepID=A0A2X0NFV4_9BASI|nr:BZ3500_MvSof-1268-A1-R1_Chr3-2g06325 [Microbotryum saponariae]SDA04296.1 BZ3501_MvSof-1269-A2-R1_Chr3-2g06016 [Microbotryum saponariae]
MMPPTRMKEMGNSVSKENHQSEAKDDSKSMSDPTFGGPHPDHAAQDKTNEQGSGFNTMYQSKEGEEEEKTKRSIARKMGEDCLVDTKSQQRGLRW